MDIHPQIDLVDEEGTPSVFAFFPYLKTKAPVRFRGIWIRSSGDPTGLHGEDVSHLQCLSDMFFLQHDLRIKTVSYAHLVAGEAAGSLRSFISTLGNVRELLAYLYSSPHRISGDPFLSLEHADLYVFWPRRVSKWVLWPEHHVERSKTPEPRPEPDAQGHVDGYEGVLNGQSYLWVARGCRIYPAASRMWLNISQDLSELRPGCPVSRRNRLIVHALNADVNVAPIDARTMTAIEWYSKSVSMAAGGDEALVDLAIAFESLLALEPQDKVRDRFKQAVLLLLGRTTRLESWLEQFYQARSDIVHEGASANTMFRAIDKARGGALRAAPQYRSLVSYGRKIFQACLGARLSGRHMSEELRLGTQMVTNKERFQRICQRLEEEVDDPHTAILSVSQDVVDIGTYEFVSEEDLTILDLLGAAQRMAKAYCEAVPGECKEVLHPLRQLGGCPIRTEEEHFRALDLVRKLADDLRAEPQHVPAPELDARDTMIRLMKSVWEYTFMHYFRLKRSCANAKQDGT